LTGLLSSHANPQPASGGVYENSAPEWVYENVRNPQVAHTSGAPPQEPGFRTWPRGQKRLGPGADDGIRTRDPHLGKKRWGDRSSPSVPVPWSAVLSTQFPPGPLSTTLL